MIHEGLKPAAAYVEGMLREQNRPRLVTFLHGYFDVHNPDCYDSIYSIPVDECATRDDVLRWLRQLSEKSWVTTQVIEDFAKALIKHFDVEG